MTRKTVYNIPAYESFIDSLARGLLHMADNDPMQLAQYRILLPTRRACRALQDLFLKITDGAPSLLPLMHPLGDIDADELELGFAGHDVAQRIADIPPAINKMERQVLLMRLLMRTGNFGGTIDKAALLASELAHLIDQVHTEGLSFDNLSGLVKEEFAAHWQVTTEFLKKIMGFWPDILLERGVIDPALRRNLLMNALTDLWAGMPPKGKVIAAGSTGSIPSTARLLDCVASLDNGCVVLPGLDQYMPDDAWAHIGETHPQYTMKNLLQNMDMERGAIRRWDRGPELVEKYAVNPPQLTKDMLHKRQNFMSLAMLPAEMSGQWQDAYQDRDDLSVENITRLDCETQQEEAELCALIMREALETPGRSATLVTPDRQLARRVQSALRRWDIAVDDSGGYKLNDTSIGAFILFCGHMLCENFAPVPLLSCLKHPLASCAMEKEPYQQALADLEQYALRGVRPAAGLSGIKDSLTMKTEIGACPVERAVAFVSHIQDGLSFAQKMISGKHSLKTLIQCHLRVAEWIACTPTESGDVHLWRGDNGEAAAAFFSNLLENIDDLEDVSFQDYMALLRNLMKGVTIRSRYATHPRLHILGQLEARMHHSDVTILGGLNEGSWPSDATPDPWMSRPMRKQFGLPSLEQSIGLAAHDFVQSMASPQAYVTRALRMDGSPTVASRWLDRINTLCDAVGFDSIQRDGTPYLSWLRAMDHVDDVRPVQRPAPSPPKNIRPKKLSVTAIEKWMRDPYHIFARYILGLRKLDDIDMESSMAERGTIIHDALESFMKVDFQGSKDDAFDKLLTIGREKFGARISQPDIWAFWWPRFEQAARWFIGHQYQWQETHKPVVIEERGGADFKLPLGEPFTITAKADRIDISRDEKSAVVIDYKTGQPPSGKAVQLGWSPQLPLEGAIMMQGGFQDTKAKAVCSMQYWQLSGTRAEPGKVVAVSKSEHDTMDIINASWDGVQHLAVVFDDDAVPYYSLPNPDNAPNMDYQDYAHLARVLEWSAGDDVEDAA